MSETFAPIRIDTPAPAKGAGRTADVPEPVKDSPALFRRFSFFKRSKRDDSLREKLAPQADDAYRMVTMDRLLEDLGITSEDERGYLDDAAIEALRVRLNRLGLATATTISGPLRLRLSDMVPVVDIACPQASRYSSITVCLYLIAWLLQADQPTTRDLAIVDDWIMHFEPRENWGGAAQGTFRWLLSRKLFMTHKRKQRMGRVRRYHNVRNRLLDCLLRLVADPSHASPRRLKRLVTIYTAIGLDPADIHSDIHRLSTTSTAKTPKTSTTNTVAKALDTSLLREMERNTGKARDILASVFSNADEATTQAEAPTAAVAEESKALKSLRQLATKEEWTREEADKIARQEGITLGAMLEMLNDLSFEKADEAVADDSGDTIYIDLDVARECLDTND